MKYFVFILFLLFAVPVHAGVKACLEGMDELEKNMGNPLGDDSYEQHLKDVNNGIQLIIKAAVK